jgi:hypothetical protein
MKEKLINLLALFGSTGTLLCCALPAALAAVAGGAAISAYISAFPWVIPLSRHKGWIFLVAGALIALNGALTLRPQGKLACAITGGKGCEVAGAFSKSMFWIAAAVYVVGAFMTYGIVPLLEFLGG